MDDRTLRRLARGVEALAVQTLGKPARVLFLTPGETAANAALRYFEDNPELVGKIELLAIARPSLELEDVEHLLRPAEPGV